MSSMSQIECKAFQLRDEAIKRKSSTSFFKQWFSKSTTHLQESVSYFKRAGYLFKMAKNWSQAATAFYDAATLTIKRGADECDAAFYLIEAASCYKNIDVNQALEVYLQAIDLYENKKKFVLAAKYYQTIGELFEEYCDYEEAVYYYTKAAEIFRRECSFAAANKCYEKVAEYAALSENYLKAIRLFEEIACLDLASSIFRHAVKEYFFRAAICILCSGCDLITKLQTYLNVYPDFQDTTEYQLLMCLFECTEKGDVEGFEYAVKKFDAISELSQWHITLFMRAKRKLEESFLY